MTTTATDPKRITYVRESREYDAFYGEQYIGSYRNFHSAEVALDAHALELAVEGLRYTAAELDAGAVPGIHACAACGALLHCDCDDDAYAGVVA